MTPNPSADAGASSRLSLDRLIAFILPALPIGAVTLPLTLYLPPHYASYVGLNLGAVGLAFAFVRTLDIAFDPFMGWVVDRTRTRFGQCRPWMVIGSALVALSVLMLFLAPPGSSVAWLIVSLIGLYAGTSIVAVAHPAWAARLAKGYHERSRLYAWMQFASSTGTFLLLVLPMLAAMYGGPTKPGANIHIMGVALAIALPLLLMIALARTPEPPVPLAHHGEGLVKMRDYLTLLRRPAIVRLVVADLMVTLGVAWSTTTFLFFWGQGRGYTTEETTLVIIAYFLAALISVPIWVKIVKVIGKLKAFFLSGLGYVVVMPAMALIPRGQLWMVIVGLGIVGLTFAAGTFLIRSMAADAADEARLETGVDRLGQVYGLLSSTMKVGQAISVGVSFYVLQLFGFNSTPGSQNTPAALKALEINYVGLPAVFTAIGLLAMLGYHLDRKAHEKVQAALAQRDADANRKAPSAPVQPAPRPEPPMAPGLSPVID